MLKGFDLMIYAAVVVILGMAIYQAYEKHVFVEACKEAGGVAWVAEGSSRLCFNAESKIIGVGHAK